MAPSEKLVDSDDDDWGTSYSLPRRPRRTRSFAATAQAWRYRGAGLALALLIFYFYWTRGDDGQRQLRSSSSSPGIPHPTHPTYPVSTGPDWTRFAYVQYATDIHSMCNAFMVFESLQRLGSQAERALLYPEEWNEITDPDDRTGQLLGLARQQYGVKMYPTQLLGVDGVVRPGTLSKPSTWEASMTKLRVFELEDFERVLYFDSDVLLQDHLDELFLLPKAPIAMPRSYWSDRSPWDWPLSGILMLLEPNMAETKTLWERLQDWRLVPERADCKTFDDDLLDDRFRSSALVLPHRPYIFQTSELRRSSHDEYMGTVGGPPNSATWNARAEVKRAKIVHFNDYPLPKPWIMWPTAGVAEMQPDCGGSHVGTCPEREIWKELYDEFRLRRRDVCKILSVPAPQDWADYKWRLSVTDRK